MPWRTSRSIAVVAMQEWSLHPSLRRMYKRSGTIATAVAASIAVYISQPAAVAAVVEQTAKATH